MYQELAIIAPTASGKTALSIDLAHKLNGVILSLDSLSVYKEIDIASAKPTIEERGDIVHFGIDKVFPNEAFDVVEFIQEYESAKEYCKQNQKNLLIVGGTSFYLKILSEGLSPLSSISPQTKQRVKEKLLHQELAYEELRAMDETYMKKIQPNDRYRVEKALEIYHETSMIPTQFFTKYPKKPLVENLQIFEIQTEVEVLRERIWQRTKKMLQNGLIDEVISLEKKYTRTPNCMKSIGIIETLEYLDGKITKAQLEELISIHTAQLAKRQRTFNKSQFTHIIKDTLPFLTQKILDHSNCSI